MLQQLAEASRPVLDFPYVRRTRRNHGLEHATITVLTPRGYRLSGRSDDSGFVLLGEVPTDAVETAAAEALRRMKNGEHQLAVHPNCGTNLVTTGFLATLVAFLGMAGSNRKDAFNRFPYVSTAMMGVVLFGPVLGMNVQKHFTTEGDPGDLEIVDITRRDVTTPWGAKMVVTRVNTRAG
jgi:hypothetical protein